jgi:hypothetical protein
MSDPTTLSDEQYEEDVREADNEFLRGPPTASLPPGRGVEAAGGRNELAEDSPIAGCPDVYGD